MMNEQMEHNDIMTKLDSFSDEYDLLKRIQYSKELLSDIWYLFQIELFGFKTSRMIAWQNNENSMDYYVTEERQMKLREEKIKKAAEILSFDLTSVSLAS